MKRLVFRIPRARLGGGNLGVDLDASVPRFLAALERALAEDTSFIGLGLDLAEGEARCEVHGPDDRASEAPDDRALASRCSLTADALRKCGDWLAYYGEPSQPIPIPDTRTP